MKNDNDRLLLLPTLKNDLNDFGQNKHYLLVFFKKKADLPINRIDQIIVQFIGKLTNFACDKMKFKNIQFLFFFFLSFTIDKCNIVLLRLAINGEPRTNKGLLVKLVSNFIRIRDDPITVHSILL